MSANTEFAEYIVDMLAPLDSVTSGRFFGGVGFKSDGVQFAMILAETLYFCVDDSTRPKYEERDMEPFAYDTKKRRVFVKKYYEVPGELLDEPDEFLEWAEEAIAAAHKAKKA